MIPHKLGIVVADLIAVSVLLGIVFAKGKIGFPINQEITYSKLLIAVWSGGLPLWFLLETLWWPPSRTEESGYMKAQRAAQVVLTFVGTVLIAIASSSPA